MKLVSCVITLSPEKNGDFTSCPWEWENIGHAIFVGGHAKCFTSWFPKFWGQRLVNLTRYEWTSNWCSFTLWPACLRNRFRMGVRGSVTEFPSSQVWWKGNRG